MFGKAGEECIEAKYDVDLKFARCTNTSLGGLAVCETVGVAWAGGTKAHTHNPALGRDARVQPQYDYATLNRDKRAMRTIKT